MPSHLKSSGERLSDRVAVGVLTQAFLSRLWTRRWRRRAGCSSGTGCCRPAGGPFPIGVNDTAGRATGDAVLTLAARRLQASGRAGDTVARLGGDEFAALLEWEAGTYLSSAWDVAHRILSRSDDAVPDRQHGRGGLGLHRNGSSRRGITAEELLHHVDLAMYAAKAAGKGRIRMHHPQTPHLQHLAHPHDSSLRFRSAVPQQHPRLRDMKRSSCRLPAC
ncbi:GGDEF domain-containing protein [Streptomyces sp. NPDC014995]|uniref:GGDEF domain-containing protein n=1 Tax=Streptomyces sp. NPDC014995 TaxID=3364936 RepID=UPI0036FE5C43